MTLKRGSGSNSKQAVRAYRLLIGCELGDTFTMKVEYATKLFQEENGLEVDGIAGPKTLKALCELLPDVRYQDYSESI